MDLYATRVENFAAGRKQPEGYVLTAPGLRPLYVPGHYNTACGGCDTIKTPEQAYVLVREAVAKGCDVLFEGIMVQDDVRRCVELHGSQPPVHVVGLTTDINVCLASIADRRKARGDERPLDPKNTVNRARSCEKGLVRLEAGVPVHRLGREDAFAWVAAELGWLVA